MEGKMAKSDEIWGWEPGKFEMCSDEIWIHCPNCQCFQKDNGGRNCEFCKNPLPTILDDGSVMQPPAVDIESVPDTRPGTNPPKQMDLFANV